MVPEPFGRRSAKLNPAIVATFEDYPGLLDRALVRDRVVAMLSGFFGLLALMLATLGLYGVMAFVVARRTAEIGIRMALGAERAAILRLVLRESLALIALGVAAGSALTLALAHTVRSLVFGIEPNDPLTLARRGAGARAGRPACELLPGAPRGPARPGRGTAPGVAGQRRRVPARRFG